MLITLNENDLKEVAKELEQKVADIGAKYPDIADDVRDICNVSMIAAANADSIGWSKGIATTAISTLAIGSFGLGVYYLVEKYREKHSKN